MADIKAGQRVRQWDGTNDRGFVAANALYHFLTDGTNTAGVDASGNLQAILAANSGVDIGDVDVTSVIPGVGATNLGKARDAVAGANDVGVAALGVRDDALTTLTEAEGDYVNFRFDSTGALWVNTGSALSNIKQDDSAFTPATDYVGVMGAFADDTTTDLVDEGDVGAVRMSLRRILLVNIADPTTDSQRLAISATGEASVIVTSPLPAGTNNIGDVDVLSVIPGTGATNLGKAVDDASGATDTGVVGLFVVDAALSAITPVDGDYAQGRVDANGALWTNDVNLDANTETNPLFVQVVSGVVSGIEVVSYQTTAAVAVDSSTNHDYTVTATKTAKVQYIRVSASGAFKATVQTGPVASLATKEVIFAAPAFPQAQMKYGGLLEVPDTSTGTIRIQIRNDDNQAQDVYSTLILTEV